MRLPRPVLFALWRSPSPAARQSALCAHASLADPEVVGSTPPSAGGAEETELPPSSVDLVFTSPPYYNLELYTSTAECAGEESQSHVKFPTPSWWLAQFVARMLRHR